MHSHAPAPLRIGPAALVAGALCALLAALPAAAMPYELHAPGLDASAQAALPAAPLPSADVGRGIAGLTSRTTGLALDAASAGLPGVALGPRPQDAEAQGASEPEHPALGTASAAPAATVAGLAAVGVLALKSEPLRRGLFLLAAPLYSRLKRSQLLDNEVRGRIYRSVEREPGLSIIQVCRAAKVGWGTAVYHLQRLERDQMIVSRRDGQYRRFFLNGHAPASPPPAQRVLQAEVARRIAGFVAQQPGCAQRDVCAALGISPPLASKWLGRLAEAGLVTSARDWKLVHYQPTPALLAELAAPRAAPGPALGATQPA